MNIYEVVFYGSNGDGNAEDTNYLVRAHNFREAVELVERNTSPIDHGGVSAQMSDIVHELGIESSKYAGTDPMILRGPYFAHAYNNGWKAWRRKLDDPTNEWEEVVATNHSSDT